MKFNHYTWNLYKQFPIGQKAIKEFERRMKSDKTITNGQPSTNTK